jgi:hypothetical protein
MLALELQNACTGLRFADIRTLTQTVTRYARHAITGPKQPKAATTRSAWANDPNPQLRSRESSLMNGERVAHQEQAH